MTTETTELTAANYATPGADLVLTVNATEEEWLEARKTGIGASESSQVLGLSKYGDRFTVYQEKHGQAPPIEETEALYWGNALEPLLRQRFTKETGIEIRRSGLLRSKEHPFMLYTPDGLTRDGGLFEAKTTSGFLADEWEGDMLDFDAEVPDHAHIQCVKGMMVSGRHTHAWIIGLIDGRYPKIRRVSWNPDLAAMILEAESDLWHNFIVPGVVPTPTGAALPMLKKMFGLADNPLELNLENPDHYDQWEAYKRLNRELKERQESEKAAKKLVDNVKAEITWLLQQHDEVKVGKQTAFTYRNTAQFSESKFKAEHPEKFAEYLVTAQVLDRKALELKEPELYRSFRSRVLRASTIK